MFDSAKQKIPSRGSKTHRSEGHTDPEEVSDPATFRDEQSTGVLEWMGDHPGLTVIGAVFALFVLVWVFWVERSFTASILTNRYVQYGVAAIALLVVGTYHGRSHIRGLLKSSDWLILASNNYLGFWLGEYKPGGDHSPPGFEPQRGFTLFGYDSEELLVEDIDPEIARLSAKPTLEPSSPALIRLHPEMTSFRSTWFGNLCFQLSDGLMPDDATRKYTLEATIPETADEKTLEAVVRELKDAEDEIQFLDKRLENVEEHRNNLTEELSKDRNETISDFTDHLEDAGKAYHSRRTGDSSNGGGGQASDMLPGGSDDE